MSDNTPNTSDQPDVDVGQDLQSSPEEEEEPLGRSQNSATDIISIPETKNTLLVIIGIFALTGFAAGLAGYFALGVFTEEGGGEIQAFLVGMMLLVGFISLTIALPVLGSIMGWLSSAKLRPLERITDEQTLTTVGVGVLAGTIIAMILAMFIMGAQIPDTGGNGGGGGGVSDLFTDIILIAIATAVAGVGTAYLNLNYAKVYQ